jgi:hypothetical protein
MRHEITEHGDYLRGVIGDAASVEDFAAFYRELQERCTARGCDRALVVVVPESEVPNAERLYTYKRAGFISGFKLALVCAAAQAEITVGVSLGMMTLGDAFLMQRVAE